MFRTGPAADWLARLEAVGVPSGPINTLDAVFSDPHVAARGLRAEVRHPLNAHTPVVANPARFSATPITGYGAPPLLGQDTDAVLAGIGLGEDERAELRVKGVI